MAVVLALSVWAVLEPRPSGDQIRSKTECRYAYDQKTTHQQIQQPTGFQCVDHRQNAYAAYTYAKRDFSSIAAILAPIRHYIHRMVDEPNTFLSLALVVSTFMLWLSTRRLWKGAEAQSVHIKKSADAAVTAQRPWIKLDLAVAGDLEATADGVRIKFDVGYINLGNTPATNVEIWVAMTGGGKMIRTNSATDKIPPHSDAFGFSVFPKDRSNVERWGSMTGDETSIALKDASVTGHIIIAVIVNAAYKFAGGDGQTRKMYRLIGPHVMEMADVRKLPIAATELGLKAEDMQDFAS